MLIDLRSDTVTKPSEDMLEHIRTAELGDDVFQEDPTVNKLEAFAAELFGKESGLFCPSGTMTNQIAIKAQTQPGNEVICEAGAHVYYYEAGGIASNSGCTTKTIEGERGVFTALQLKEALRPKDLHFPTTSLVSIENTCNRGGGKVFPTERIKEIKDVCTSHQLQLHLDGARIFNALSATNSQPQAIGKYFDTISVCLSKGLGAPIGSVLLGNSATISKARKIRKSLGGGMRQAGTIAAAGIYALENNINRLKDDHSLAKDLQQVLNNSNLVSGVLPVETNIVVFELARKVNIEEFINHLKRNEIWAFQVGPKSVRFVTHMDLPTETPERIKQALESYSE